MRCGLSSWAGIAILTVAAHGCWLHPLAAIEGTDSGRTPAGGAGTANVVPPTAPSSNGPKTTGTPIYSRQTTFVIPFSVDASNTVATEVQLFVSLDRGATWKLYTSRPAAQKQFQFRAARDGDYWFASRTVAPQDRAKPAGKLQPELAVRIDTAPPKVEFQAQAQSDGTVVATWQASDANLAPATLKIEYQATLGQPWQLVSLDNRSTVTGSSGGKVTFRPDSNVRALDVRFEVRDLAGNRETLTRRVFLTRGGSAASGDGLAKGSTQPPADPYAIPPTSKSGSIPWPADNQAPARAPSSDSLNEQRYSPVTGPVRPSVSQQARIGDSSPNGSGPPAGELPHVTNSKKFNLDYDLDSVGPSGVKEVELWATRDGGASWSKWGTDEDNKSPFAVEVEEEGQYGYRMVVVGGTGLASTRPRPGDMADVWVNVDLTKPIAKITSAIYGAGDQAGQLDIRWEASDTKLAPRPIALFYAEKADGPWQQIATGLANSGQHFWPVPPNVPQEVYLKLEVRDEAGNKGIYQVERAVSIEGLAPHGRIRGVRPSEARLRPRSTTSPTTR